MCVCVWGGGGGGGMVFPPTLSALSLICMGGLGAVVVLVWGMQWASHTLSACRVLGCMEPGLHCMCGCYLSHRWPVDCRGHWPGRSRGASPGSACSQRDGVRGVWTPLSVCTQRRVAACYKGVARWERRRCGRAQARPPLPPPRTHTLTVEYRACSPVPPV